MKIGEKDELIVNGHKIKCIQASREGPKALPWKERIDVGSESSGETSVVGGHVGWLVGWLVVREFNIHSTTMCTTCCVTMAPTGPLGSTHQHFVHMSKTTAAEVNSETTELVTLAIFIW